MDMLLDPNQKEDAFVESLAQTVERLEVVAAAGLDIASKIDRLYMVSCGAGYWIMQGFQWWADKVVKNTEVRTFTSADVADLNLPKLNTPHAVFRIGQHEGNAQGKVACHG